jgi:hypothetical protein
MGQKRCLNARRLTRKQVSATVAEGATLRRDLMECFRQVYASGHIDQPLVYEMNGDRFLFVFDENGLTVPGKGDIYPGDYFRRFARWHQRTRDEPLRHVSSVAHWCHFSKLKASLPASISRLTEELARAANVPHEELDYTYASLDSVSRHVEQIGADVASQTIYDHLVAYVGEAIRVRTKGEWRVDSSEAPEPCPYVAAVGHAPIMPINAVWGQLDGLDPVDLRRAAADEVRHARAKSL